MATSSSGDDSPLAASNLMPPSYPEMIVAAIASLAEDNDSSQAALARRIEAEARGDLPASHPALVAAHLARMSAAGELVAVVGGKYALPPPPPAPESPVQEDGGGTDEESPEPVPPPAKRGRGRPPKARPPGFPTGAGPPAAPAGVAARPSRRTRTRRPRSRASGAGRARTRSRRGWRRSRVPARRRRPSFARSTRRLASCDELSRLPRCGGATRLLTFRPCF